MDTLLSALEISYMFIVTSLLRGALKTIVRTFCIRSDVLMIIKIRLKETLRKLFDNQEINLSRVCVLYGTSAKRVRWFWLFLDCFEFPVNKGLIITIQENFQMFSSLNDSFYN